MSLSGFVAFALPDMRSSGSSPTDIQMVNGVATAVMVVHGAYRARAQGWDCPPCAAVLDSYQDLEWWEKEQRSKQGS